jgi:hypothetical protein
MRHAIIFAMLAMAMSPAIAKEPYEQRLRHPVCEATSIKEITARLAEEIDGKIVYEDPKEVGSAVTYENGISGVSYEYIAALSRDSRVGDPIKLCFISRYENCPLGDDRGKTYSAINLRTGGKWTLPDSEHRCGGA